MVVAGGGTGGHLFPGFFGIKTRRAEIGFNGFGSNGNFDRLALRDLECHFAGQIANHPFQLTDACFTGITRSQQINRLIGDFEMFGG